MGEWDNYCGEIGEVCKDLETQAARIAELEKMAEARKLANRLLEQERNELEAERDRLRETLQDEHITSNARREKIIVLKAERDRLREALQKIAEMEAGSHEPSFEMRGCMTSESCMNCDEMIDIAREALGGSGKCRKRFLMLAAEAECSGSTKRIHALFSWIFDVLPGKHVTAEISTWILT